MDKPLQCRSAFKVLTSISILATTYLSTFFVANAANMDMYLIMNFDTATCKDLK